MNTGLREIFDAYSSWYVKKYVPTLVEDDPEDGLKEVAANRWDRPLRGLRVVDGKALTKLEESVGPLPTIYRELLTTVGAGTILAACEGEPTPHRILRPATIKKARRAALASLSTEDKTSVDKHLGLDTSKMLPIIADGDEEDDEAFWIMLTLQTKGDDRVVILDRDHETGWPFGRKKKAAKPFIELITRWIACAKKLEPLNPFDGL